MTTTDQNVASDGANTIPQTQPIWGNPMDWLTFFALVIVLVDHLIREFRKYWAQKRKNSGYFEAAVDESSQNHPTLRKRKNKKKKNKKLNAEAEKELLACKPRTAPSGINFYDLAKIYAIVTMIIDHYGYFGLPGISWTLARWTRVIGRTSAPTFFFLIGYSDSFRFRWHSFMYGVFLFACNAWLNLRLTATSFESIVIVLTTNMVFQWVDIEKLLNRHWAFHILLFAPLAYFESFTGDYLRIAYGSQAYMLIITGLLVKRSNKYAKMWAIATMIQYCYLAVEVFGRTPGMFNTIIALLTIQCFVFMFANQLGGRKVYQWSSKLPSTVRDFLLYISRNAIIVYVVHLQMFRLIQMKTWNW
jgi:ABC-type multidrug transport system fused ATPase/permease subunit